MGERVDAHLARASFGSGFGAGFNELKSEINTWTGTLNGKVFASTGRLQPYALAGIGFMQAQFKLKDNFTRNRIFSLLAAVFNIVSNN